MITVIDDLFEDYSVVVEHLQETKKIQYASEMVSTILNKASEFFDLSTMEYYEAWTHGLTRPADWHYDKDEALYQKEGVLRFPLCSNVFYPIEDDNLVGGNLIFENGVTVKPKRNRLVVFAPGLYHSVQPFRGKRISININPWNSV